MLTLEIGRTRALPLDLKGTTFGTYLRQIEEKHNVTLYNYSANDNLIIYTGEIEALRWFVRKELHADWDDIEDYIITMGKNTPPLWNLMNFSDLLRMNEWDYTMTRLEGYVAPYQYKMKYKKTIDSKTIIVKIPWMSLNPQINIFEEHNGELIPLETFKSTETYLPFQDAIAYLNALLKEAKEKDFSGKQTSLRD